MPNIPNPNIIPAITPSDFVKNDSPAETDDLELGQRNPGHPTENPGSDADAEPRRTGGSANDPHGGRG